MALVTAVDEVRAPLSRGRTLPYARQMPIEPSDSALMLRYKDGDVAAFETLYRRHKDSLYRYLLQRSRQRAAAEDVFQDVWGKIIGARGNYRPTAKFTTFLYHIAHNCFVDYLRRNSRHKHAVEVDPDTHADPAEPPEMQVERNLARKRLHAALVHLPDDQRDAFLLHEEAGLGIDEIASVTGCNRETAKSRLRYAMNKLRAAIDEPAEVA